MNFFGEEMTTEDMPTYQSFKNSPNHLYSAMQDTLNMGLSRSMLQQNAQPVQQPMNTMEAQPSAWNK